MKTLQTMMTLALLLPLAGCWNGNEHKKTEQKIQQADKVAGNHQEAHQAGKCSHKGCKHDHSKKEQHQEVKIQDVEEMEEDLDFDDAE